jgi:hypothetical protein
MKSWILAAAILVMGSAAAFAAAQYGVAEVEKGNLTVVRDGNKLNYSAGGAPVNVVVDDVLLVQKDSRVVLRTLDKAVVTIGSNAAFQVRPWESQDKSGHLRALFGRFRVKATALAGQEFNVKTATATIGIKGTEYIGSVTSQGDAMILVEESTVQVAGLDGVAQPVRPDLIAVSLNGREGATAPSLPPEEVMSAMRAATLDAPSAVSAQAASLPAEAVLVKSGIISQKDVAEAKLTQADFRDGGSLLPEERTPEILFSARDLKVPAPNTSGRIYLNFER